MRTSRPIMSDPTTTLRLGDDALELNEGALAAHPGLRELHIRTQSAFFSAANDNTLSAIAASPALADLEILELDMCRIRGPGLASLAQSPHLGHLRELLLYVPADPSVCRALATSPAAALRPVERLALCADMFNVESAKALCSADDLLRGLRCIELRIDESSGFDWASPFQPRDEQGHANTQALEQALAVLIPRLLEANVTLEIRYTPAQQTRRLEPVVLAGVDLGSPAWPARVLPAALIRQEVADARDEIALAPVDDDDDDDELPVGAAR
jgi:hypothetical protein